MKMGLCNKADKKCRMVGHLICVYQNKWMEGANNNEQLGFDSFQTEKLAVGDLTLHAPRVVGGNGNTSLASFSL